MTGCWVGDHLLEPWERAIVARYTPPQARGGTVLYYDLDAVSPAGIRALCWPRQPRTVPATAVAAGTVAW